MKKKESKPVKHICYVCGQEIEGDHVYIKTRRKTELHIHFGCMPICEERERENEQ